MASGMFACGVVTASHHPVLVGSPSSVPHTRISSTTSSLCSGTLGNNWW